MIKTVVAFVAALITPTADSCVRAFTKTAGKLRTVEQRNLARTVELKATIESLEGLRISHFDEADRAGDLALRIERLVD